MAPHEVLSPRLIMTGSNLSLNLSLNIPPSPTPPTTPSTASPTWNIQSVPCSVTPVVQAGQSTTESRCSRIKSFMTRLWNRRYSLVRQALNFVVYSSSYFLGICEEGWNKFRKCCCCKRRRNRSTSQDVVYYNPGFQPVDEEFELELIEPFVQILRVSNRPFATRQMVRHRNILFGALPPLPEEGAFVPEVLIADEPNQEPEGQQAPLVGNGNNGMPPVGIVVHADDLDRIDIAVENNEAPLDDSVSRDVSPREDIATSLNLPALDPAPAATILPNPIIASALASALAPTLGPVLAPALALTPDPIEGEVHGHPRNNRRMDARRFFANIGLARVYKLCTIFGLIAKRENFIVSYEANENNHDGRGALRKQKDKTGELEEPLLGTVALLHAAPKFTNTEVENENENNTVYIQIDNKEREENQDGE